MDVEMLRAQQEVYDIMPDSKIGMEMAEAFEEAGQISAPTPGPWYVLGEDELTGIEFIEISSGDFGPEYRSIAWVGNQPHGISDEDRANANVMAASWEMLEALKMAREVLGRNAAYDAVCAAIAKAEGRS